MSSTVAEIDFSELRHGIEQLKRSDISSQDRISICRLLIRDLEGLPSFTALDDFRQAVWYFEMQGRMFSDVEEKFTDLLEACSGWSLAQVIKQTANAQAKGHGKKSKGVPKPSKKSPINTALVKAMRTHRQQGRSFKETLQHMLGGFEGLRIVNAGQDYSVRLEDSDLPEKLYSSHALEKLFSEAKGG